MSRVKLKQILSNLHYDEINDQLILSSSRVPSGEYNWENVPEDWDMSLGNWNGTRGPDFIISGSVEVTQSAYTPGAINVKGILTADSGSFTVVDLGEY